MIQTRLMNFIFLNIFFNSFVIFCSSLGLLLKIEETHQFFFNFPRNTFYQSLLDSLPCLIAVFKNHHRDNNMIIVYINFPLSSNDHCRDSTIFFSVTCILTFILGLIFRAIYFIDYLLLIHSWA